MTGGFSLRILRAISRRCTLVGLVQSSPRGYVTPPGGDEAVFSPMRAFAVRNRLPFFLLKRGGPRCTGFFRSVRPDVVFVAGATQLLRREEFEAPPLGTLNLHPALLPKYRGPMPYFWQSYDMEREGGVTVHFIDETSDTGDIVLQRPYPIDLGESFYGVLEKSIQAGSIAAIEALSRLTSGTLTRASQRGVACPRYARFVHPGENLVDWEWPLERVWHFLRGTHALNPFLPAPDAGGTWNIGAMIAGPTGNSAGSICHDQSGDYLAHRDGQIRLRKAAAGTTLTQSARTIARRWRNAAEWWSMSAAVPRALQR